VKTATELTTAILEVADRLPPEERAAAVEHLIAARDAEIETAHAEALRKANKACGCCDGFCAGDDVAYAAEPEIPCAAPESGGRGYCGHLGADVAVVEGKVRVCETCARSCEAVGLVVDRTPRRAVG